MSLERRHFVAEDLSGIVLDLDEAPEYEVVYMGSFHFTATRYGNIWYEKTPCGYKRFALQGRVRPLRAPQRAR
jgi:hypothetical protein